MKTAIMLVPMLGQSYSVEMKQAVKNFVGVMNIGPENEDSETMPVVVYNGTLSGDEKATLGAYMNSMFPDIEDQIAMFFIEYKNEPEQPQNLMFKEECKRV